MSNSSSTIDADRLKDYLRKRILECAKWPNRFNAAAAFDDVLTAVHCGEFARNEGIGEEVDSE